LNPLDFSGPVFLLLYAAYGAVVWLRLRGVIRSGEPQRPTGPVPTDPVAVAFLRGGAPEALRVITVTLLDRGVLVLIPGDGIWASSKVPLPPGASALDRALREHFASGDKARSIFTDALLLQAARAQAERPLEAAGLIPDAEAHGARQDRFVGAFLTLAAPAAIKIAVALSRDHENVMLLVGVATVFICVAYNLAQHPRTPAGDAALEYLELTFEPVRRRVLAGRDAPIEDLAITAAVFGIAALPATSYAHTDALQPRQNQSGCGGGCGGDGGGGGCGGCGGCGG
jgi:uncharacterized protein (TIGR04222 family)